MAGHGAKRLLQMRVCTGSRREGESSEDSLDASVTETVKMACPATAGRLREELFIRPCTISVLCCLKWTSPSKMSEADKSGKIAGGTSVFSRGHNADCKLSLQSDLLTTCVLLCCTLSAQRYIKVIKMNSPHFSVK